MNIPSSAAIGAAISWFFEFFPFVGTWFSKQSFGLKRALIVVLTAVAGVLLFLHDNPGFTLAGLTFELVVGLVANVLATVGSSQIWHTQINWPLSTKTVE